MTIKAVSVLLAMDIPPKLGGVVKILCLVSIAIFQLNRVWYQKYLVSILTENYENDAHVVHLFLNFW